MAPSNATPNSTHSGPPTRILSFDYADAGPVPFEHPRRNGKPFTIQHVTIPRHDLRNP